jgi:hypothetical protein
MFKLKNLIFSSCFFDSVGFGNSTSKKDAQANAARDFGAFLVREGMIDVSELPSLSVQRLIYLFHIYYIFMLFLNIYLTHFFALF